MLIALATCFAASAAILGALLFSPIPRFMTVPDSNFDDDPRYKEESECFSNAQSSLREEYVEVEDGLKIHVWIGGDQSAKSSVLFLHGWPETGLVSWFQQVEFWLNHGYFIMIPDLRGFGQSTWPREIAKYRPEESALDMVKIIRHYRGRNGTSNVISHDWGGMVHWMLMLHHEEVLDRNVVTNMPHPKGFADAMPGQALKSWYFFFFQLPYSWLRYRMESDNCAFMRFFGWLVCRPNPSSGFLNEKYLQLWSKEGAMDASLNWYRVALRNPVEVPDKMIGAPLRILWGAEDRVLSIWSARYSTRYCTNCTLTEIPNVGHFVQHEATALLSQKALEFFEPHS